MESDPAAQPLPSSADEPMMEVPSLNFLTIDTTDLPSVVFEPGSVPDSVSKPKIIGNGLGQLPESSLASSFYQSIICTTEMNIPEYCEGDCPWCVEVDTILHYSTLMPSTTFEVRRKKVMGSGLRLKRKDEVMEFIAGFGKYDGGFVQKEVLRRKTIEADSVLSGLNKKRPRLSPSTTLAELVGEGTQFAMDKITYSNNDELAIFCNEVGCLSHAFTQFRGSSKHTRDKPKFWKSTAPVISGIDTGTAVKMGTEAEEDETMMSVDLVGEPMYVAAEERNNPHCSICADTIGYRDENNHKLASYYIPQWIEGLLPILRMMWVEPNSKVRSTTKPDYLGNTNTLCVNGVKSLDICKNCHICLCHLDYMDNFNPLLAKLVRGGKQYQKLERSDIYNTIPYTPRR